MAISPTAQALITAPIQGAFDVAAGKQQAKAANKAAILQAQSNKEALRFTQQQAAQEQANFQTTEKANYEQYMAEQGRLEPYQRLGAGAANVLQTRLGLPAVDLPATPAPPVYQNLSSAPAMPPAGQTVSLKTLTSLAPQAHGFGLARGLSSLGQGTLTTDTVMIQGPDGSQAEVPTADKDWWLQRGGRLVMGGGQ